IGDAAIIRIEQLYPLAEKKLRANIKPYPKSARLVWCQEESQNMGAWSFIEPRLRQLFSRDVAYAGRNASASPAVGALATHKREQACLIAEAVAIIDDSKVPEEIPPAEKKATPREKKKEPTLPETKAAAASKQKSTGAEVLSPAVRRIVEEEHLEPAKISGTGKDGRLTKGDVLAAAHPEEEKEDRDRQAEPGTERFTRKKMSPLRRKIAAQLVMAQQTAAILTTFNECDMSAIQELRAKSQEGFTKKNGIKH